MPKLYIRRRYWRGHRKGSKGFQPSSRNINNIHLRLRVADGKIVASVKRDGKRVVLEEFSDWPAAERWAKRTRDFTIVGTPFY